jgi:hypothetical protein
MRVEIWMRTAMINNLFFYGALCKVFGNVKVLTT